VSEPLLRAKTLGKSFGATRALDQVSFEVRGGEVRAIVGENGAGKSTLVNILSGVIQPDAGGLEVGGRDAAFDSPRSAQRSGVATVHQELSLAEHLSVAENVFAGRLPSRLGFVDGKRLYAATRSVFEKFGVALEPSRRVDTLPMSSRQVIEIAKALTRDARVILLDEPTSALNADEKSALFELVRRVRAHGIGIVFISHHLEEVMALSDRVSVLRDGRLVASYDASNVDPAQLVRDMVGRDVDAVASNRRRPGERVRLLVDGAGRRGEFDSVSFALREGEILALAGLVGSGRAEAAAALAGVLPLSSGSVRLDGAPFRPRSVAAAKRRGVGYIPAERKTEGLFLGLPVDINMVAASLERVTSLGLYRPERVRRVAERYVELLRIRTASIGDLCGSLSGGNQQKTLFAKWLETRPRLLIIEEPTKGVDVAAKAEIHREMVRLAGNGASILFVSSDLPEMLSLAHRILVMRRGRVVGDLDAGLATEHDVMELASGVTRTAA
jgi:ribose transport system ATP-binding protein